MRTAIAVLLMIVAAACTTNFDPEDTDTDTTEDAVIEDTAAEEDAEEEEACTWYFRDADNDGYGHEDDSVCAMTKPSGYVEIGGDCCDTSPDAHPAQDIYQDHPYECPVPTFDYNCDGAEERQLVMSFCETTPPCSDYTTETTCIADSHHRCYDDTVRCGESSHYLHCVWRTGGYCELVPDYWTADVTLCR